MYLKFALLLGCIHGFSLLAVDQDNIKKGKEIPLRSI